MQRILLIFILLVSSISIGQKYPVVTYSTEEGLPQSQGTSFAQGNKGYLWVGTLGGLAKFGGTKFNTYSTNHGLLNNRITTLEFFDGKLWVGHDGGISYSVLDTFKSIEFLKFGFFNPDTRSTGKMIQVDP